MEYWNDKNFVYYCRQALLDGYVHSHTAMLAHCPIPKDVDQPFIRTIVVLVEAAFACIFWSMRFRHKSYGFADDCPWPRESFTYNGHCSHSPLLEGENAQNRLLLSPEQLEEEAAATKEKNRTYQLQYGKALRANPTPQYKHTSDRNNKKQKTRTQKRQTDAVANKT